MQKVLTAEEMREVDRLTTEKYGIPPLLLMENAAHGAARVIAEKLGGSVADKSFLILCGKGNNGGDGAALARILWAQGAVVYVHLFGNLEETKGVALTNFEIIKRLDNFPETDDLLAERNYHDSIIAFKENAEGNDYHYSEMVENVVVDALFGTGLNKPIQGHLALAFENLCQEKHFLKSKLFVALDIPSGLNANLSEQIGSNFLADLTVTFTAPKPANVLPPASRFNGELITVNIGSPQELIDNSPSQLFLAEKRDAQNWLQQTKFTDDSYKKTRGHALIIAGSKNMIGAAVLCADAAMQSGIGLVTLVTPESAQNAVAARVLPEIMVSAIAETANGAIDESALEQVLKLSEKMNVVAIGCGLSSNEESTRNFVGKFVENRQTPIVIDADGLNALAPFELQGSDELPLILTPHIGELRRLLGVDENFDLSDRVKIARDFAQKHHVILVLKGERSLIAEPGGKVVVNPTGNSGLGKAGNGDTLTGIITGFVAQSFAGNHKNAFETTIAALYISGMAGDIAAKKIGMRSMTASDVRECLSEAFRELGK